MAPRRQQGGRQQGGPQPGGRQSGGRSACGPDPVNETRKARRRDRDDSYYERRRRELARRREALERRGYDPAPPTDDDWTVSDEDDHAVRRVTPPTPIKWSLDAVLNRRGWSERLRSAEVHRHWEAIVGADIARRCEPVRLAGGTLVIRAQSQVWATQLRYLLPQLQKSAARELGDGVVRSIRIVVGPLEGDQDSAGS